MEHNDFYSIRIGLASPEMIHDWSYGEVTKPETINYRSQKPEVGGLFCERIFGPTKDGTCSCGKYKGSHSKTVIKCEKCGVDVTTKKVRRERLGHIDLATPVSHIWYFKAVPSRMATVLDMSPKALEQILYYAQYVVTNPGITDLAKGQALTDDELNENLELWGANSFEYGMGAESIMKLLKDIDCETLTAELKEQIANTSGANKVKLIKRLDVVEAFRASGNKPEWMILTAIPVLPPEIRPMVQLDGGRFASSDLNELYRRVIYRNNRLKLLLEKHTPEIIVRNEKRMVQEAVDALIDNGKRGKAITGASNRPLKSLSEMLRGKQGRFRQNLLGKRVDYSGRSVIVVGPSLKIYQCGLPKEMAIELFKPFVIKRMVEMGDANNMKDAQKKIDRAYDPANAKVWDALENVIKEHPVLLNRAPTLHRLSIQAFEPVLVEGKAIKLHPLVCPAFNADFDGDQMPVHVPLSSEAQAEARFLMLSANNLLKPMDGKAVTVPSQDMILGAYYLTMEKAGEPGENSVFRNFDEAEMAYSQGIIGYHTPINVRGEITTANGEKKTGIFKAYREENGKKIVHCTLGRLIYNKVVPQNLGFVNRTKKENEFVLEIHEVVKKKVLGKMIDSCIRYNGPARCATMLDDIKALGYQYSTKASFSISVYDMTIPKDKWEIIGETQKQIDELNDYFEMGLFSEDERYHAVINRWEKATDTLTKSLNKSFSDFNPIKIMADSGARGSEAQMRQLGGMRGLMFATNGKTIEIPIKSNFREGLNVTEYFMGAKGSRKSLSDTALRTADSGYLTRRLVDVSSSVIISEIKCDTKDGFMVEDIIDENSGTVLEKLSERILGRYAMGDVVNPATGEVIVENDQMIDEDAVKAIEEAGIKKVQIRSAITCHASHGVCAHCYGADMSNGKLVSVGEAVGIIAAQSIGEPGTQLTMRTFHSGGVAGSNITQGLPRVEELFEARTPKKPATVTEIAGSVHIELNENNVHIITVKPESMEESTRVGGERKYTIPYGTELCVTEGKHVEAGDPLTEGNIKPDDVLKILGLKTTYDYIIKEVQKVYRAQSCNVNDKHVEIIARQMTRKVEIKTAGNTHLIEGSVMDVSDMEDANKAELAEFNKKIAEGAIAEGTEFIPAEGETKLLGITKAALQTESFLSAASFQETTRVLTDAAIHGKIDYLRGLKENVIIGKLIPAGTGMKCYKNIDIERVEPELPPEDEDLEYDEAN